eukprot:m.105654 g.105654  ORF g.105654 m.105654 type:complete len:191 (-) comp15286_c0_seq1:1600-2172(-)
MSLAFYDAVVHPFKEWHSLCFSSLSPPLSSSLPSPSTAFCSQQQYTQGIAVLEALLEEQSVDEHAAGLSLQHLTLLRRWVEPLLRLLPDFKAMAECASQPETALPLDTAWLVSCGLTWNQPSAMSTDHQIQATIAQLQALLLRCGEPTFVTVARSVEDHFTPSKLCADKALAMFNSKSHCVPLINLWNSY